MILSSDAAAAYRCIVEHHGLSDLLAEGWNTRDRILRLEFLGSLPAHSVAIGALSDWHVYAIAGYDLVPVEFDRFLGVCCNF